MKYLNLAFLFTVLAFHSSLSIAAGKLQVRDAWIPEAPPVADVMAAYFEIDNAGSKPVTITGFSCKDFGDVMMHKTVEKDGMSSMIHMDKLTVAAKSKLKFERGGLHLMLMMPKRHLKQGQKVALSMHTADNQTIKFTAIVKPASLGDDDKK
jgi:copper(I)-binding protein